MQIINTWSFILIHVINDSLVPTTPKIHQPNYVTKIVKINNITHIYH